MKHVYSCAARSILLPLVAISIISISGAHAKKGGDSEGSGSSGGGGGGKSKGGGGGSAMDVMIVGADGQIMNG